MSANTDLSSLTEKVQAYMTEKRFRHTLGVVAAAEHIGRICLPDRLDELRVAALLHDITKEYSPEQQARLMQLSERSFDEDDYAVSAAHHSFTAPEIVSRDFPQYATRDVLSAIFNHTLGAADMTLFDEIVFISDFVEEGRTYPACIELREDLYSALLRAEDRDEAIDALHYATLRCLDFTVNFVRERGYRLHGRTLEAMNAFSALNLSRIRRKNGK